MRFVKEVRLDAARTRLLSEGARASEVALRVGYESPAHFARDSNAALARRQPATRGSFVDDVAIAFGKCCLRNGSPSPATNVIWPRRSSVPTASCRSEIPE